MSDAANSFFGKDSSILNELNQDSFFLIRGESTVNNSLMQDEDGVYIDLSEEFVRFEIMMKPRGNAISRFFSTAYVPKDLFVYYDG